MPESPKPPAPSHPSREPSDRSPSASLGPEQLVDPADHPSDVAFQAESGDGEEPDDDDEESGDDDEEPGDDDEEPGTPPPVLGKRKRRPVTDSTRACLVRLYVTSSCNCPFTVYLPHYISTGGNHCG